jgi:hypothetical protein
VAAFFAAIEDYCDMFGYVIKTTGSLSAATPRKSLDNPELWAPSPEHVSELLRTWRPEEMAHDEYVQVVAAVKASYGPRREEFKAEVLAWSPGIRSTEDEAFEKRWDSIKDSSLGWNWLTAKAGFFEYEEVKPGDNPAAENSSVGRMLKDNVWVKDQEKFHNTTECSWNTVMGLNAAHTHVRPYGPGVKDSAAALFLNSTEGRKVVTATSLPGEPIITKARNKHGVMVPAVNMWRPSSIVPAKNVRDEDVAPYVELTDLLFGPKGSSEREHVLNYPAYILQNPGKKIGHALGVMGPQGCGKDSWLRPFFEAVGLHNVATISTKDLQGQFNYYTKFPVIYFQEAKAKGKHDLYNELKPHVSAQATFLPVNEKGLRQYFVPNFQNWIFSSNHDDAIALEADDRRFSVHRVLLDEALDVEYFDRYHHWCDNGGIEKVAGWLLERDLSGFNPMARPADTAAKRAMCEASRPPTVQWVCTQLKDGGIFAGRTVLTVRELRAAASREWSAPQHITEQHAMTALKAEGFKAAHRVRLGNSMERLWARGVDGSMTADAMRALYRAETEETEGGQSCKAA